MSEALRPGEFPFLRVFFPLMAGPLDRDDLPHSIGTTTALLALRAVPHRADRKKSNSWMN